MEQLTYLLFLKMVDERSAPPYNQSSIVPAGPDHRQGAKQVSRPGHAAPRDRGFDGHRNRDHLKTSPLTPADLSEFVASDKTSLDIFWCKDDSPADSDNLPAPGVIALEIVEDLQAALDQFKLIAGDMAEDAVTYASRVNRMSLRAGVRSNPSVHPHFRSIPCNVVIWFNLPLQRSPRRY